MKTTYPKKILILVLINLLVCTHISAANIQQPDFISVAKKAIPAVVSIKVSGTQKQINTMNTVDPFETFDGSQFWQKFFNFSLPQEQVIGQASGFIVSNDGYILTNTHVVKNADEILVFFNDNKKIKAKLIGMDSNTEIALIKVDAKNLPYLALGDSDTIEVGQWVAAIGTPMGLQATFTQGIVSAKGRNNLDLTVVEDYIQTDTSLNKGNSGGPLLNMDAEVIGINTAKGYDGIGFAVPSNIARNIMTQLMSKGEVKRGFIGILPQEMDENLAKSFGVTHPEGVLVAQVTDGSPAEKAGIKQGDVIIQYNTKAVNSPGALRNAISMTQPGSKVPFVIMREGNKKTIIVEIGELSHENQTQGHTEHEDNVLGIHVVNLTEELAEQLGYRGEKGVIITKVDPSSVAAWAGLQKGSLILSINKTKIESVDQFLKALQETEKGGPILLLIKEGKIVRYVSLKID